jgi:hypothetical protein
VTSPTGPAETTNGRRCSRRQAKYLLAAAKDPAARQWADDAERSDLRTPGNLRQWTPGWAVARSAAHVAAAGDLDPMHRFIDHGLADDHVIAANLNYWAYWSGEHLATWNGDSAMTQADDNAWNGTRLLSTLLSGINGAPYRDLCAHSLWALLLHRRHLAASPERQTQIKSAVTQALQADSLAPSARRCLEQVDYLVRSP